MLIEISRKKERSFAVYRQTLSHFHSKEQQINGGRIHFVPGVRLMSAVLPRRRELLWLVPKDSVHPGAPGRKNPRGQPYQLGLRYGCRRSRFELRDQYVVPAISRRATPLVGAGAPARMGRWNLPSGPHCSHRSYPPARYGNDSDDVPKNARPGHQTLSRHSATPGAMHVDLLMFQRDSRRRPDTRDRTTH